MAREAAPLMDRFQRPLFPGVKVELHSRLPIVYTVVAIMPVVDPRAPAGVHRLVLTAEVSIQALGGAPIEEITAVTYPKAVDVDRKPGLTELPAPKQNDDSPAGGNEYVPPEEST